MRATGSGPRALRSVPPAGTPLVCRRHVDLCRTSSAICPSARV
ncbi:putative leader peptide [Streptomyces sp. NPDC101490]